MYSFLYSMIPHNSANDYYGCLTVTTVYKYVTHVLLLLVFIL